MNDEIYDNLIDFGIKFWIRDGELYFKYYIIGGGRPLEEFLMSVS